MGYPPPEQLPPLKIRSQSSCATLALTVPMALFFLAVFAKMVIPVYEEVQKKAEIRRKLALYKPLIDSAESQAKSLQKSLERFHSKYGRFPALPEEQQNEAVPLRSRGPILAALLGIDSKLNPQNIIFLYPPAARDHKNGLEEVDGVPVLLDPWGEPYYMVLDWNNDGIIPDPAHPGGRNYAQTLIFSSGPDRDPATWDDNVRAWPTYP